jgi:hypothetical protein
LVLRFGSGNQLTAYRDKKVVGAVRFHCARFIYHGTIGGSSSCNITSTSLCMALPFAFPWLTMRTILSVILPVQSLTHTVPSVHVRSLM